MKWFKHESSASNDDKISMLEAQYGHMGYAVYFKLVELCASNWDEVSPPEFIFSRKKIHSVINLKSVQTDNVLGLISTLNLFQTEIGEFAIKINFPKLLEIRKRYQKQNVAETSGKRTYQEENKNKNKNKKGKSVFDIDAIYYAYPRKEGKKKGIERLQEIITSQEIYDQVLLAVNNYAEKNKDTDLKFIKQFSSFTSVWQDYLEIQISDQQEAINQLEAMQAKAESEYLAGVKNA